MVYIESVYVLAAIAFSLLYIGHIKEDFTTLFFSGILFVLLGLTTFNNGFADMTVTFAKWVGIIFMTFGGYVLIRASLDYMQGNYDGLS